MEPFTRVSGVAAAMPAANINTDIIMPKQFLNGIDREGLADGLFHDLRFDGDGTPRADYLLNRAEADGLRFLVVGPNFGCGSSREHAVWGMLQYGIRALVGTSFAGIFADNAANNGLLLVSLQTDGYAMLAATFADRPGELTIDLEAQRIAIAGSLIAFEIDPARRRSLMLGLDRIAETLGHSDAIRAFEAVYLSDCPWLVEEQPV